MSTYHKTKTKIVAHLLEEKEASYKNMMQMQSSEMNAAETNSEDEDHMFDGGKTGQVLNRVEARSSVVEALQRDIDILSGIESIVPTEEIQLGDVIETDKGHFFVAVAADEFVVEGITYRGISVDSPLYKALRGKKNGDTITINENSFVLKNSY